MGTMEDRLDSDVESWRPEPGESITGEIVGLDTLQGDYEPYPVIEIRTDDDKYWSFHAFHTVAKKEIARHAPSIGDRIGIKYYGKVDTKPGSKFSSYEKYRIIIEKQAGAAPTTPDWSELNNAAEKEANLQGINDTFPGAEEEPF